MREMKEEQRRRWGKRNVVIERNRIKRKQGKKKECERATKIKEFGKELEITI